MPDPNETPEPTKSTDFQPNTADLTRPVDANDTNNQDIRPGEEGYWDLDKARQMAAAVQREPIFHSNSEEMDKIRAERERIGEEQLRRDLAAARVKLEVSGKEASFKGRNLAEGYSGDVLADTPAQRVYYDNEAKVRNIENLLYGDERLKRGMDRWAELATRRPEAIYDLNPELFKDMTADKFLEIVQVVAQIEHTLDQSGAELSLLYDKIRSGDISGLLAT